MTPKKLGVLILTLFALWSLVGPGGAPTSKNAPSVLGVSIAQAGDPDQYVHKTSAPQGGSSDTTIVPPPPVSSGGEHGGKPSPVVNMLLEVIFLAVWGFGAAS
jgi:hypothetical protein